MLRDPKSKELSESFAYQWLRLNVLLGSQPDRKRYPDYYDGPMGKSTLAAPFLQETLLLFETVLIENRSILDLIDSSLDIQLEYNFQRYLGKNPIHNQIKIKC